MVIPILSLGILMKGQLQKHSVTTPSLCLYKLAKSLVFILSPEKRIRNMLTRKENTTNKPQVHFKGLPIPCKCVIEFV